MPTARPFDERVIEMKVLLLTVSLGLGWACALPAVAQVAVVVNPKSPATALSKDQAAALYLGRTSQLPGVGNAVLVDQAESNAVREQFYTKVADKSAAQVKAVWSRLSFSGKGTPPKELGSSAEVKKYLATNPDAVGYIEKSAVDDTVKVILSVD
jgi:ABC-type phosphate transport system substrate-binding protein